MGYHLCRTAAAHLLHQSEISNAGIADKRYTTSPTGLSSKCRSWTWVCRTSASTTARILTACSWSTRAGWWHKKKRRRKEECMASSWSTTCIMTHVQAMQAHPILISWRSGLIGHSNTGTWGSDIAREMGAVKQLWLSKGGVVIIIPLKVLKKIWPVVYDSRCFNGILSSTPGVLHAWVVDKVMLRTLP